MTWNVYWGQCAVKYDRILWWNFNSKVEIKDITPKISDNIVQVTVNIHNLMKLDCAKFQLKKEEGKNNFFFVGQKSIQFLWKVFLVFLEFFR